MALEQESIPSESPKTLIKVNCGHVGYFVNTLVLKYFVFCFPLAQEHIQGIPTREFKIPIEDSIIGVINEYVRSGTFDCIDPSYVDFYDDIQTGAQ